MVIVFRGSGSYYLMTSVGRYLITGGAGFIGSHLADLLVAEGHSVRVLDDLSSGRTGNLPTGVELIRADVTDRVAVRRAVDGVRGCFHLAAIASIEQSRRAWLEAHRTNVTGTITVFDAAARVQCETGRPVPVVYASSAAVYGDPLSTPIAENAPLRPLSAYAVDKVGSELHAAVAAGVHRVPTVGLRFFNVYGPRQDPASPYSGVISIFAGRLARGEAIELHGDGSQVRDFIYVGDVVRALRQAMQAAGPDPQIFNVCTGKGLSIRGLGETIAHLCGTPFRPEQRPRRAGDVQISVGDPRKILQDLGFTAEVGLHEGLAEMFAQGRDSADEEPAPTTAGK